MLPDLRAEVALVKRIAKGRSPIRSRQWRNPRRPTQNGSSGQTNQRASSGSIALPWARYGALLLFAGLSALLPPRGARADGTSDLVPIHAIMPRMTETSPDIALSGQIQARVQSNISFRLNGKVIERRVDTGDHVTKGQVLAVLDPVEQRADVDNAKAALNSAEALLQQAKTTFERQKTLLESGYTTRASFDSAEASLKTNQAQVDAARAALGTVTEQMSYTDLKATSDGIVVSRSVEVGEVVQTGETVFVIAEDGPRDAVFNIFESLLTRPPKNKTVDVVLQSDPSIHASGEVREISPTIDPATSTVKVKIGLTSTPPAMTLGAAIVGRARWEETPAVVLPWSALFDWQGQPAVWLVDDKGLVSPKVVTIARYGTGSFTVAAGLDGSERVVTAGIQFLYPGQKVMVTEGTTP